METVLKFLPTTIDGAQRIELEPHKDERGYFARTYCIDEFATTGILKPFIQDSIGHNLKKGTLRGLHYHAEEFPQTRLFRCFQGSVFGVILDLRKSSTSYLRHEAFELNSISGTSIFVPSGVALGYQTLEDETTVYYQMSELYEPQYERGVRWNDPSFGIKWPGADRIINIRDAEYADYDQR